VTLVRSNIDHEGRSILVKIGKQRDKRMESCSCLTLIDAQPNPSMDCQQLLDES